MRVIIVAYFILHTMGIVNAQSWVEISDNISIKSGLSSNYVNAVIQDSDGFIWIGTNQGLNRFDGYNSKTFMYDEFDSNSLSNNWVKSLLEDSNGNIWIGTEGGGLNLYNNLTGEITRFQNDPKDSSSLPSNFISRLYEDSQNRIWIGTLKGLCLYDSKTKKFQKWNGYVTCDDCDHYATSMAEDHLGNLWVADDVYGLFYFNPVLGKYSTPYPKKSSISLNKNFINDLIFDEGLLWIGTDEGLILLNTTTQTIDEIPIDKDPTILNSYIMRMYQAVDSELWVCTKGNGLINYRKSDGNTSIYNSDKNVTAGQKSKSTADVLIDKADNLWVATSGSGLNRFNLRDRVFEHKGVISNNPNSLINNEVRAIHQDLNGFIWLGTNNGVSRYDIKKNQFRNYLEDFEFGEDAVSPRVRVIFRSSNNVLWVGTQSGGLYKYLPQKDMFVLDPNYTYSSANTELYDVQCAYEVDQGVLWIGTGGIGLIEYNTKSNEVKLALGGYSSININERKLIYCIIEKGANEFWTGSDNGLQLINRATNEVKTWKKITGDTTSLIDDKVRSLYQDTNNDLWVGTRNGLSKMIAKTGKFERYSVEDGLASEVIYGIMPGTDGNLWLSTAKGLTRLNTHTMKFKKVELPQNESLDMGAYENGINGTVIVGGPTGFSFFKPTEITFNKIASKVVFTNLQVNYENFKAAKEVSSLDTISLTYDQNNIKIEFSALEYANTQNTSYKYFLKGLNKEWINHGIDHDLTFTNLDPGSYRLYVKGSNRHGDWSEEDATIYIYIKPPWWGTWLFRLAVVAVLLILLIGLYNLKVSNFRRRQKELEEKVEERTIRLKEANDKLEDKNVAISIQKQELEKSLSNLKLTQNKLVHSEKMASLGVLSAGIGHEINNPLNFIQGGSIGIKTGLSRDDINKNDISKWLDIINEGVRRAKEIVISLSHFSRKGDDQMTECQVHEIIDHSLVMLNNKFKHKVKIHKDYCSQAPLILGNDGKLHQLFLNVLSNAEQAIEGNGNIHIDTSVENANLMISIKDDGCGIPEKDLPKVLDPFFTSKSPGEGTGLGLSITHNIIQEHGGEITINSKHKIGTEILIKVPAL